MARKRGKKSKNGRGGARPGSGPKPIFADRVMRSVSFERAQMQKVERIAESEELSFAAVVRLAVDQYLKRRRT